MGTLFPNTPTAVSRMRLSSAWYLLFTDGGKRVFSQTRDKITNREIVLWKPGFSGMPESFSLKHHNERDVFERSKAEFKEKKKKKKE